MDIIIKGETRITEADLARMTAEEKRQVLLDRLQRRDAPVVARGAFTRAEADGSARILPHTAPHTFRTRPGEEPSAVLSRINVDDIPEATFDRQFIKRTPEQRLDSLTKRYVEAWKRGEMNDGILKEIVGEFWKLGTPISADRLREVAAQCLNQARREQKVDSQSMTVLPRGYNV